MLSGLAYLVPSRPTPCLWCCVVPDLQEASGVLAEVAELTMQNQALNKTFMGLAGAACPLHMHGTKC